jgi:hypothetical protein
VKRSYFVFTLICLVALSRQPVYGQVEFGSMVGNVTDQSGGAIPGTLVKITLTTTNDTRSVTTDSSGAYTISTVTPGTYHVEITRDGFTTFVATGIQVNQNNTVRVNAQLAVGSMSQRVEVTTTVAAQLQTDRADVHAEISSKDLVELPQPNRTYLGLLDLVPGVTPPGGQLSGGTNNPFKGMNYSFNGGGLMAQTIRIEGINALMPWGGTHGQNYVPSPEAIENVNVATNATDAEQVMSGGSTVQVILKSGSNETHGGFYDYNIVSRFEANNFFSPYPKPPHLVDNDVGGFLGGHILRNKLFYFGSYEGDFNNSANSGVLSIPNAAQLSGNMTGSGSPIYDPATGNPDGTGKSAFPGNMIPSSRFDPIALKIIPNIPATNIGGAAVVNNYFINDANVYNLHKIDTKFDWNASSKLRLSGRWGYSPYYNYQQPIYGNILGGASAFPQAQAGNYLQHGAGLAISVSGTYIVSPTFVIDATWGKTTSHQVLDPNLDNQAYGRDVLGIPGANPGPLPWYGGVPNFNISGFVNMGMSYPALEYREPVNEYVANATKIQGSHTIRFGADYSYFHPLMIESQGERFAFDGGVTTLNGGPGPNQYNSLSAFLLGEASEVYISKQEVSPYVTWKTPAFALHVGDLWHVNSKLTVNLGLRWEYYPVNTRDAAYNNGLNANGGGLYFLDAKAQTVTICGTTGSGLPEDCGIHVSKKLFAPTIGIAYRPTEKTVVRMGYTLSPYNDLMGRLEFFAFPGERAIDVLPVNPYVSSGTMRAGFPDDPPPVGTNGIYPILPATGNLGGLPSNKEFTRGYLQSYNVTVQRELPGSLLASVAYVGTHAVKLFMPVGINYGQLGGGTASQPFANIKDFSTGITTIMPWGEDVYNSLQATLNKRMTNGFTLQGAYTYSKDIGMATSILIPQYTYYDHTTTALDRTHHLAMSGTYELPFGKSKPFLSRGIGAAILGGWMVNGRFNHYSGAPFTVTASGSTCNCPGNTQTANQVLPDVNTVGSGVGGQAYFNPLAYAPVTTVSFGSSGLNRLRGPGSTNLDAGIFRTIPITERFKAQIRAEAINVSNTPHFANPGANVSNLQRNSDGSVKNLNGFSQITSTNPLGRLLDQRYFRFALRFTF